MKSLTGTNKIHHAAGLYIDGIRDGKVWEALKAHTGDRYTQHSTGVGDGQQGFADFFEEFLARNPARDIEIVRAIEDDRYVFLQAYQSLNNGESRWVTGDLFDTDANDRVIEHWDVIQAFESETKSGRTMTDGPTEVEDLESTETNKARVREFCDRVLVGGAFDQAAEYVSSEEYAQHTPAAADGLEGFGAFVAELEAAGRAMRYWKVHKLIGQGNFVVAMSHVQMGQAHYCVFDLFRLKDGMIVEHWDVQEKILPPELWNNQGKF